jgi:predicted transcriptional regulator
VGSSAHVLRMSLNIPDPHEVERRVREAGLTREEFLAKAGIHIATWNRWKRGAYEPRLASIRAVLNELEKLPESRSAAPSEAA